MKGYYFLMKIINPLKHKNPVKKYFFRICVLLLSGSFFPFLNIYSQSYFQQKVNYDISVTLNDKRHDLSCFESVEYINNSPDTLRFLYFHLWPNGYSNNNTALAKELLSRNGKSKLFDDPEIRGFIDSLDFRSGGQQIKWELMKGNPDICKLLPQTPLKPGDTLIITTPFHVKIPLGGISRLGHTGESYQISQWYPKPAVYDRRGWHEIPYLDQGEFYSEYGSFNVKISVPSNYVVGATGKLQNAEEVSWLDNLAADTAWMRIPYYYDEPFPPSSTKMKTLIYIEDNIHDFAWFADKRFHVLKGHVKLPESGREVTTMSMFTNKEAFLWKNSISYLNSALWYFSKWNGDYPYGSFTAVQSTLNSGDGMEYPELTVISATGDSYLLDEVLAHELCHSWFYSAIGSDERRYPFMDESITAANESRYMHLRYPDKKLWELLIKNKRLAEFMHADKMPVQRIEELEWVIPARVNLEQSINLPAPVYSDSNYGSIIYEKASQGFNYLRSYLGDSVYDNAMHEYYRLWENKHPMPDDLREVFETTSKKDLSWFFDDLLGTTKRLDYKIARYKDGKVLIKNKGELNSPLLIAGKNGNSIIGEKWVDGFKGKKWFDTESNFSEIKLDPEHKMTELFRLNNNIRTSGLFRKADPLQFQLLYVIEDPDKRYLVYLPAFNWNKDDGFMLGVVLSNSGTIPKRLDYFLMPFYAFSNSAITGLGKVSFNVLPYNNFIRLASFSLEAEKFGAPGIQYYNRIKTGVDLYLRSHSATSPIDQLITGYYITASDLPQIEVENDANMLSYLQLGYQIESKQNINPFNLALAFEAGEKYQKTSIEANYKISYNGLKDGLESRFFAGTMINNSTFDSFYSFSASGRSGPEEYLYQGVFPDRFTPFHKSFFSREMSLSEGGLASPVNDSLGYSRWLISFSTNTSLPGKASIIPVKPYISLLLNDHGERDNKPALFFEAGFKAGIWNLFEVYFPLVVSHNIESMTGPLKERIRFILKLDRISPIRPKFKPAG